MLFKEGKNALFPDIFIMTLFDSYLCKKYRIRITKRYKFNVKQSVFTEKIQLNNS